MLQQSTPKSVDTKVVLRGHEALGIWNPHSETREQAEYTQGEADGQPVSTVRLVLPSVAPRQKA